MILLNQKLINHTFHMKMVWTRFVLMVLGIWLLTSPATFGYAIDPIRYSDWISGLLLITVGVVAIKERWYATISLAALVGLWLQAAPLLFWADDPVAYLNDTLIGILAIAVSLLVPLRPPEYELGPHLPPGWTYNPSSWPQRIPVIFCALLCWFISRYLASYQLHYIDSVWDPFFRGGSQAVLSSPLSRSFPLSDAGVGAMAYSLEAILGAKGGARRWHTMPWIVLLFGILTVPVGFVSLLLMMLQPILVGAWCGWCLIIMLLMLVMLALTLDELLAVCHYLRLIWIQKKPFWRTFFFGSDYEEESIDTRTPTFDMSPGRVICSMFWGVRMPWNLFVTAAFGAALLVSATLLKSATLVAYNEDVCGILVLLFSFIAAAEVARSLRLVNLLIAFWLLLSIWILPEKTTAHEWFLAGCAVGLFCFSLPRGRIKEKMGAWNRWIF